MPYKPVTKEQIQFKETVAQLLDPTTEIGVQRTAAFAFYDLCASFTKWENGSTEATQLNSGKAISPEDAARCIQDFIRTAKFIQGLEAAILDLKKCFPEQQLNLLYAGCGPFAPLALAIAASFSAAEIRFTLLDIHQESLDSAAHLFQVFGLTDRVADFVLADATTYQWPSDRHLHLLVSETMQRALDKEPQVAITQNLAPQLCEGGILIPENIRVEAVLCIAAKEFEEDPSAKFRIPLGVLLDLNAATANTVSFQPILLKTPDDLTELPHCMLFTTITIYGDLVLNAYESGLTYPMIFYPLGKIRAAETLEFQYQTGKTPGFTCARLEKAESQS